MPTGSDVRRKFLEFFVQKGHREVHSSSLVPANDPTLLFTNAGMNQFKDVFLGLEKRDYRRATTSQKCVRAGGKHNDLENVGFTNRHHTFFEMLGNFSFGDYFKREAIAYAWELITSPQWYGLSKDKLYVTIFNGEGGVPRDEEAHGYWREQGVAEDRIHEMGLKDNFWQMGDTGPCGPCSEIHYDMGLAASEQGHADCRFPCDCGRYVEIWNLVFMQFDRKIYYACPEHPDVERLYPFKCDLPLPHESAIREAVPNGRFRLDNLPAPSIDTGMGLERVTAVLQGVTSNYETDLFVPLIKAAAIQTGVKQDDPKNQPSLRIIADHSRAATFLIADGIIPSTEGRGYVLRKIIRRAIRHGRLLGAKHRFFAGMAIVVAAQMEAAYPELRRELPNIERVIANEEIRFAHTLDVGLRELQRHLSGLSEPRVYQLGAYYLVERKTHLPSDRVQEDDLIAKLFPGLEVLNNDSSPELFRAEGNLYLNFTGLSRPELRLDGESIHIIPDLYRLIPNDEFDIKKVKKGPRIYHGKAAFKLYDTFGLPLDFIVDAARDQGIAFDQAGFDEAMSEQRVRAQASWKGAAKATASPAYQSIAPTVFEGYRQTESSGCEVLAIIRGGQGTREIKAGEEGEIILDHTPFYADSGGQVGDRGWLYDDDHNIVVAEVTGCYSPVQGVRAHRVTAREDIRVGDKLDAVVDLNLRQSTMRHHTATHLVHAALREVLGKHVKQAGSLVAPDRLRFDFSHFAGVEDEEMQDIEDIINKEVLRDRKVEVIEDVPIDVAVHEYKAMALFGEKYGERVRVIRIGDFSTELCGGTHTAATGEIGLIKILDEGSVSSGVRRVEAVAGESSLRHFRVDHELEHIARGLVRPGDEGSLATALQRELHARDEEIKRLRRELEQARMKSAADTTRTVEDKIRVVQGVKVLAHRVDNLERSQLRTLVDNLRQKLGSGVVVLGSASDGKVALIVGVTKDLTGRVQAGKVIAPVAQKVGGSGGGRPDMAEAGGKDPEALDAALSESYSVVEGLLG